MPPTRVRTSTFLHEAALALLGLCRYEAARDLFEQFVLEWVERPRSAVAVCHRPDSPAQDPGGSGHVERDRARRLGGRCKGRRSARAGQPVSVAPVVADEARAGAPDGGQRQGVLRERRPGVVPECASIGSDVVLRRVQRADARFRVEAARCPKQAGRRPTRREVETVVRYTANNVLARAMANRNYNDEFWCLTTLAGIDFVNGRCDSALATIRKACSLDAQTTFQLRSFQARLQLVQELALGSEDQQHFVESALVEVNGALQKRLQTCVCRRVFVSSGRTFKPGDPTRVPVRAPRSEARCTARSGRCRRSGSCHLHGHDRGRHRVRGDLPQALDACAAAQASGGRPGIRNPVVAV